MINSFRLALFMLLTLSFIALKAMSSDFSEEEIADESKRAQTWWQTHKCLVMLSKEFQSNKKKGVAYKFTHRGNKGLRSVAKNDFARDLDNEGLMWRKNSLHKTHVWSTELCRGIKDLSSNPFYLSYADLYAFYRVKDQLKEGKPMAGLWNDLFPSEKAET